MTLRFLLALAGGLCATAPARGLEPTDLVRASIATKGDIWVGQRVTLVVELLAPGIFNSAPAFDLPHVPGVVIMKPEDRPTLGSETIGGVSCTVQRHEFAVFAQRAGSVQVPGFSARFEAAERFGAPGQDYTVRTPAVIFEAKMPPGAEKFATVITTRSLTVKESWAPEPGAGKVGAAFTRTITVEARDVPGMVLPSFALDPPEGLSAYPKPPEVTDRTERGELTGRRVETVTYVCEKPGDYKLPALVLAWWNPHDRKLNRENLPARTFTITGAPQPPAPPAQPSTAGGSRAGGLWLAALGAGLIVLALLGWRFGPKFAARWARHEARVAGSERTYFAAFERACQAHDAHAIYRALVAWLDRFALDPPVTQLDEFAERAADPQLTAELTALQDAVFKPGANSSPRVRPELAHRVRIARSRLSRSEHRETRHGPLLPPLNPT